MYGVGAHEQLARGTGTPVGRKRAHVEGRGGTPSCRREEDNLRLARGGCSGGVRGDEVVGSEGRVPLLADRPEAHGRRDRQAREDLVDEQLAVQPRWRGLGLGILWLGRHVRLIDLDGLIRGRT
jgi:hypothetical protein